MYHAASYANHRSQTPPRPRWVAALLALAGLCLASASQAEIPLDPDPIWESTPNNHVATGGAWADIDGDGWLDMVVANGNDIYRQQVVIYHNNGDGTLPANPTWSSSDIDYHGHLDIGDINGDGMPDVAVGVYIGPGGFSEPGRVKVYLNNGAGAFSASPDWIAEDIYSFSVALGDADGDGDLDLACACGDDYYNHAERQRIFFNDNGVLESSPSWVSDEVDYALDVFWGDVDQDGDMDVAFCGTSAPMRVYLNAQTTGGGIATTASWENTDLPQYGNTTAFGDWNGDGFPELAVADNSQLGGPGKFKVYGNSTGALGATPAWNSNSGGYGSHVSWCDLDLDGDPELGCGRWWGNVFIYENTGGDLTGSPAWTSNTVTVIENMFWGDVDNTWLRPGGLTVSSGDGVRTFFPLGHAPVRSIDEVRVDGLPLDPDEYVVHLANGWVSLATPAPTGAGNVQIEYTYSTHLDLGVTNWDSSVGNLLFQNTSPASAPTPETSTIAFSAYPNPVAGRTFLRYRGLPSEQASLRVVDANGRLVRTLHNGPIGGEMTLWEWDRRGDRGARQPSGVYFAHLQTTHGAQSTRVLVVD